MTEHPWPRRARCANCSRWLADVAEDGTIVRLNRKVTKRLHVLEESDDGNSFAGQLVPADVELMDEIGVPGRKTSLQCPCGRIRSASRPL